MERNQTLYVTIISIVSIGTYVVFALSLSDILNLSEIVKLPISRCSVDDGIVYANYDGHSPFVNIANTTLNTTDGVFMVTAMYPGLHTFFSRKDKKDVHDWVAFVSYDEVFDCYYNLKSRKAWSKPVDIKSSMIIFIYSCIFILMECCYIGPFALRKLVYCMKNMAARRADRATDVEQYPLTDDDANQITRIM